MKLLFLLISWNMFFGNSSNRPLGDTIQLTHQNYKQMIGSDKPMVVDINASWCSACKMMNPIIDELSEEYQGRITFAKIDYDSQHELTKKYDVEGLPTILFIKAHQTTPFMKVTGGLSKEEFEEKIAQLLN